MFKKDAEAVIQPNGSHFDRPKKLFLDKFNDDINEMFGQRVMSYLRTDKEKQGFQEFVGSQNKNDDFITAHAIILKRAMDESGRYFYAKYAVPYPSK